MNTSNDFVGNVEDVGAVIKAVAGVINGAGAVALAVKGLRTKNRKLREAVAAEGGRDIGRGSGNAAEGVGDAVVIHDAGQGEVIIAENRVETHEGQGASAHGVDGVEVVHEGETEGAVMAGSDESKLGGDGSGGSNPADIRAQIAELVAVQGAIIEQLSRLADAVVTLGKATSTTAHAAQKNSDSIEKNASSIDALSRANLAHTAKLAHLAATVQG